MSVIMRDVAQRGMDDPASLSPDEVRWACAALAAFIGQRERIVSDLESVKTSIIRRLDCIAS